MNKEHIPAPSGGDWGFSTINGNAKRGTGILNNEMYVGQLIWNRQRFVKDPDTGKRQARLNDRDDWVIHEVPELRVVDPEIWTAAKARQTETKIHRNASGEESENQFRDRRRPKYLLSGLTKCGQCGGGYSMVSADQLGCSTARNKGTCTNRINIRRDQLEARVLNALRNHLMDPGLFAEFCAEFTRKMNTARMEAGASIASARAELERIAREFDKIMSLYLKDVMPIEVVKEKSDKLQAREMELEAFLAGATDPPPLLHPEMASFYRARVGELYVALQVDADDQRNAAAETLRTLIDEVILSPEDGQLTVDVRGDLAGILEISLKRKKPAKKAGFAGVADVSQSLRQSQVEMVAGVGFEPTTFRL